MAARKKLGTISKADFDKAVDTLKAAAHCDWSGCKAKDKFYAATPYGIKKACEKHLKAWLNMREEDAPWFRVDTV